MQEELTLLRFNVTISRCGEEGKHMLISCDGVQYCDLKGY